MGFKDLYASERGIIALIALVGSIVIAIVQHVSFDTWSKFALGVITVFTVGKTFTGYAEIKHGSKTDPGDPPATAAPTNPTMPV